MSDTLLTVWHLSMQFSDSTQDKESDVEKLFRKASKRDIWWVTGTESGAGSRDLRRLLRTYSDLYGFRVFIGGDCWIAVNEKHIKRWRRQRWAKAVDGVKRQHPAQGSTSVQFRTHDIGVVSVFAGHLLTRGRTSGIGGRRYRARIPQNKKILRKIERIARRWSKGSKLGWYGGDQNEIDRRVDTFMGISEFVSCWDESDKYPKTHPKAGNIDVIAHRRSDNRVSLVSCRRYTDKQMSFNTDHFLVEATYNVRHLKRR